MNRVKISFISETTFDFLANEEFDTIKIGGGQELKDFWVTTSHSQKKTTKRLFKKEQRKVLYKRLFKKEQRQVLYKTFNRLSTNAYYN